MSTATLLARVAAVRAQALDVRSIELRAHDGPRLPAATPGAHLDLHLPGGLVRTYSIFEAAADGSHYRIGVGRDAGSRGGSAFVHEQLRVGDVLPVSAPRNHFPLSPNAGPVVLIAGGIGITPLLAMARQCAAEGREWTLHYCARSPARAAFLEELHALDGGGARTKTWFSTAGARFDAAAVLSAVPPDTQVYCCGPERLMDAVEAASAWLAPAQRHFERFVAPASDATPADANAFELRLQRSGVTVQVPADRSVLECIEDHGIAVPFSCREGLCGTCETSVLDGTVDHRDFVLSAADKRAHHKMLVCVSRAACSHITLDL
jgi:ferredoxin-NADP reductase